MRKNKTKALMSALALTMSLIMTGCGGNSFIGNLQMENANEPSRTSSSETGDPAQSGANTETAGNADNLHEEPSGGEFLYAQIMPSTNFVNEILSINYISSVQFIFRGEKREDYQLPMVSDFKFFVNGIEQESLKVRRMEIFQTDISPFRSWDWNPYQFISENENETIVCDFELLHETWGEYQYEHFKQYPAEYWFEAIVNGVPIRSNTFVWKSENDFHFMDDMPEPPILVTLRRNVFIPMTPADPNESGNTNSNIVGTYGAFAVYKDGWIYYIGNTELYGNAVHKMRADGTEKFLIMSGMYGGLNIVGEWIFARGITNHAQGLFRFRTDGAGFTLVVDEPGDNFIVVGDWIYYRCHELNAINKIRTDGTDKTVILQPNNGYVSSFNITNNWIYYIERNLSTWDYALWRVRTDGTEKATLGGHISEIVVEGDWIYYTGYGDGGIYKVHVNGTDSGIKLDDEWSSNLNVVGDWIYFRDDYDGFIYKLKTDGSDEMQITDEQTIWGINIAGDWIFYYDSNQNLYKIRTDGTGRELLALYN